MKIIILVLFVFLSVNLYPQKNAKYRFYYLNAEEGTQYADPDYVSDFTSGFTGWTSNRATRVANNDAVSDGVTSYDNCLKVYCDGSTNTHYAILTTGTIKASTNYRVQFKYYIPSGQTHVDGFKMWWSGDGLTTSDFTTVGSWVSIDTVITTPSTLQTTWYHLLTDGGAISYTGANSASDDRIYLVDYSIREVLE